MEKRSYNRVVIEGKEYNTGDKKSYEKLVDYIFKKTKCAGVARLYLMQFIKVEWNKKTKCGYGKIIMEIETINE